MSKYKTVYTEVEVELDISQFDTEDLIDELESRDGYKLSYEHTKLLEEIWLNRRNGKDYQQQLDNLIYNVLGHIV